MKNPWARIIGIKPDGSIVSGDTDADDVTADRIHVVVCVTASTADDTEGMTVQVYGMLHAS